MPTHFLFVLLPEFTHLAFSCAIEPLRIANLLSGKDLYRWTLASEDGEGATASNGTVTRVHAGFEPTRRIDRIFIIAGMNVPLHASPRLLAWMRRERAAGTPLGAICSGAYILARAGFLDGVETAVHWAWHDLFIEEFPLVKLVPNVFVAKGRVVTASGGTAATDLMLHLIAAEQGDGLAAEVADQMFYSSVRGGSAKQRLSFQARNGMRNEHVLRAVAMMEKSIADPLSPAEIAEELGISTRQLERLFARYLQTSPKQFFLKLRLRRARTMLVQTEQSVISIAMACGFESTAHFSKVFRAHFGCSPVSQRVILA